MSRPKGSVTERRSAVKAESNRKNAKKPRPKRSMRFAAAAQVRKDPDVRQQVAEMIARARQHWPACEEIIRQILHDDLRGGDGKPLREPVYANGSVLLDKRGRPVTVRVHVTPAQRLAVAQDLYDRTGYSRQVTQKIEASETMPAIVFRFENHPKPSALRETVATNGHAEDEQPETAGEIPPPAVH